MILVNEVCLENNYFYYGRGKQASGTEINATLLENTGSNICQIMRDSLLTGILTVTQLDEKILPKFEVSDNMKKHLEALELQQQEENEIDRDEYQKFGYIIIRYFSVMQEEMH